MRIDISAKLDTRGFDRVLRNGPDRMDEATQRVAKEVLDDVREHWSGVYPPASTAGKPPAIRSGKLHRSGRVRAGSTKGWTMQYRVVFEVGYAQFLEKGTQRMAERPFLKPAIIRARKNVKKRYKVLFQP